MTKNRTAKLYLPTSILVLLFLVALLSLPLALAGQASASPGWEVQTSGTTASLYDVSAADDQTAWVRTESGLLKTSDGGASWGPPAAMPPMTYLNGVEAVSKDVAWVYGYVYYSPLSQSFPKVYKTVDGGANWQLQYELPWYMDIIGMSAVDSMTAWLSTELAIQYGIPPHSNYWTGINMMKTTDGGTTWSIQYAGPTTNSALKWGGISAVDSNTAWAYYHNDILRTVNGTDWSIVYSGIATGEGPYSIAAIDANRAWLAYMHSIFKTSDGGLTWVPVLQNGISNIASVGTKTAFAVSSSGIYRTTDGGATWTNQLGSPGASRISAVDANTAWAVGGQGRILHTTDGGGQPVPIARSITPGSDSVGGTVTIDGSAFGAAQGTSYVSFGSVKAAEYLAWSDKEITCRIPLADPGPTQVTVSNANGSSDPLIFSIIPVGAPAPTVSGVNPATGINLTTLVVKITGSGFIPGAEVRLQSGAAMISATGVVVSGQGEITCNLDLNGKPLGKYDVIVKNIDGQEGSLAGGFIVTNVCGQGSAGAITLFAGLVGLLSLAGFKMKRSLE